MTPAGSAASWSKAVLDRDKHCRWTGCTRVATDPAHLFSRWYPSLGLIIEDGLGMCHAHHVQFDNLSREKKRAVTRLLLGRQRYEKLARYAHEVHLK